MPTLTHPCPHCTQPAKLDTDRLPDQPVAYPCPHCKQKVLVEKRQLLSGVVQAVSVPPSTAADRRFNRLPSDARFPSGIIVGDDDATIQEIRSKLAAVGSEVEAVESFEHARQTILNEDPELCILVTSGQMTAPHEAMTPLTGLPPSVRRRTYLALVGDDLKTLDGTEAFLFEVNVVLGKQDLAHFEAALYSGIDYHRRLYRPYFQAIERKNSLI